MASRRLAVAHVPDQRLQITPGGKRLALTQWSSVTVIALTYHRATLPSTQDPRKGGKVPPATRFRSVRAKKLQNTMQSIIVVARPFEQFPPPLQPVRRRDNPLNPPSLDILQRNPQERPIPLQFLRHGLSQQVIQRRLPAASRLLNRAVVQRVHRFHILDSSGLIGRLKAAIDQERLLEAE